MHYSVSYSTTESSAIPNSSCYRGGNDRRRTSSVPKIVSRGTDGSKGNIVPIETRFPKLSFLLASKEWKGGGLTVCRRGLSTSCIKHTVYLTHCGKIKMGTESLSYPCSGGYPSLTVYAFQSTLPYAEYLFTWELKTMSTLPILHRFWIKRKIQIIFGMKSRFQRIYRHEYHRIRAAYK